MFKVHMVDGGHILGWEKIPAAAITPQAGMAMVLADGVLNIATGTAVPTYMCMSEADAPVEAGTMVHVVRVTDDQIWETTLTAATEAEPGGKLTIAAGGMELTGTTGGAAEIVELGGKAIGDWVRVRFK